MSVPDFQSIMLPLLKIFMDGKEHSIQDFLPELSKTFNLTEEDLSEMISSGKQTTFYNRVGWARTYLFRSGLLELTRRSYYRISPRGKEVLASNPKRIDIKFLQQFPEFLSFRERDTTKKKSHDRSNGESQGEATRRSPQENLEEAYEEIVSSLAQELLIFVKKGSPRFFEQLVIELLVKMGYGGSYKDSAKAVGKSGDEGIDGVIDGDRLGLDTIYVQAKRWDVTTIGRPEIQKFVGALAGKNAHKGIFITTSTFSDDAYNYVKNIQQKVVLIDGKRLTELMIEFDVGVSLVTSFPIKKIDTDYFDQ